MAATRRRSRSRPFHPARGISRRRAGARGDLHFRTETRYLRRQPVRLRGAGERRSPGAAHPVGQPGGGVGRRHRAGRHGLGHRHVRRVDDQRGQPVRPPLQPDIPLLRLHHPAGLCRGVLLRPAHRRLGTAFREAFFEPEAFTQGGLFLVRTFGETSAAGAGSPRCGTGPPRNDARSPHSSASSRGCSRPQRFPFTGWRRS